MKLDSYYGPTAWDSNAGSLWHYGCPDDAGAGHEGEVMYWKDSSASCTGCDGYEEASDG